MKEPQSRSEWQEAVDAAHAARVLEDARSYGLVTGGPQVNAARCDQILADGKQRGILPAINAVERFVRGLLDRERPRGAVSRAHHPSPYG